MTICKSKQEIVIVDLDGTLIKTDSMIESTISVLKDNPLRIFSLISKLLKGKVDFKKYVFEHCAFSSFAGTFPVNKELVDYLKEEKKNGAKLYLVSASDERAVKATAEALDLSSLFDAIYGTTDSTNLKGNNKLEFIKTNFASKQSEAKIIYCGDSVADLVIWKDNSIHGAVLVGNKTAKLEEELASINLADKVNFVISSEKISLKAYLKAIRIHQWAKNTLLFVPLLCSFSFFDISKDLLTLLAFISFSLGASATYILNDLWDLPSDRVHPTKSKRALASGKLSIEKGVVTAVVFLGTSALLAGVVSIHFLAFLIFYLFLTTSYSLVFKKIVLLDIIVLAWLYITRIVTGNVVCGIEISYWLLSFSFMIFLSLGTLKRYVELQKKQKKYTNDIDSKAKNSTAIAGRGYSTDDLDLLIPFGISTYMGSIVLFGIYITSSDMVKHYSSPWLLWFVQIIFLYLIGDMWLVAKRGKMLDDPVLYFVTNKKCLLCLITITVLAFAAYYL